MDREHEKRYGNEKDEDQLMEWMEKIEVIIAKWKSKKLKRETKEKASN